jgi:membrane associated rhomboid family serine protease
VTYALIATNVLVFFLLQGGGTNEQFTYSFSCVPREIATGEDEVTQPKEVEAMPGQTLTMPGLRPTPGSVYLTLLTSMFMHGGLMHLLGNMLFLWIFGDNVEDSHNHLRYLIFYLVCGLVASLAHVFTTILFYGANSEQAIIPSLGASGAISGIMGGYLVLHPQRRVMVLLLRMVTYVPSYVAIGMWFLFQVISSMGIFGEGSQTGGVAYAAHIGGFLAGLVLGPLFAIGQRDSRDRSRGAA